ncbi:MAG: hypothetical protein M3418_06880 [Gemmatimonadota bacterium]|nr:hypothetical protein [Gemmatimonadota bacterium]
MSIAEALEAAGEVLSPAEEGATKEPSDFEREATVHFLAEQLRNGT